MDIHRRIEQELLRIEKQEAIHLVFAVEAYRNNSTCDGTEIGDSELSRKVRFVYARRPWWYISVFDEGNDVIEMRAAPDLDIVGWDLRKALTKLCKSDTELIDWLKSPRMYRSCEMMEDALSSLAQRADNVSESECNGIFREMLKACWGES